MRETPQAKATRKPLVIRCTGRLVDPRTFRPVGRVCGRVFKSATAYRSRANWIERARAAGWRVSPLASDNTVTACCPTCHTGKKRKKKEPPR